MMGALVNRTMPQYASPTPEGVMSNLMTKKILPDNPGLENGTSLSSTSNSTGRETKPKSAGLEAKSEGRASTMLTRTNEDEEKKSVARKMLLGS